MGNLIRLLLNDRFTKCQAQLRCLGTWVSISHSQGRLRHLKSFNRIHRFNRVLYHIIPYYTIILYYTILHYNKTGWLDVKYIEMMRLNHISCCSKKNLETNVKKDRKIRTVAVSPRRNGNLRTCNRFAVDLHISRGVLLKKPDLGATRSASVFLGARDGVFRGCPG